MLACHQKRNEKRRKGMGIGIASKRYLKGGPFPCILLIHHREEEEKKRKTPESVCHAQIGTSQISPCIPEQGRKAKAEDVD
jgi:hypothetical protein